MSRSREAGFTLVELAVVLVIIGIILGALMKGQALINNARAKRVFNDLKGLEAVIWSFYDRYGRFPGDCDKNGVIDATTYTAPSAVDNDPSAEFCTSYNTDRDVPWAELKAARLLSPDADNMDLARTQFSAWFYIGRAYAGSGTSFVNAIAIADIPCFVAKSIDVAIDGKLDAGAGRIRQLTGAYTASNSTDTSWSACGSEDTAVDIVYFFDKLP